MDNNGGIAVMVVVGVVALGIAIALGMHLMSGEMGGARRGVVHRVIERLPFQSIKIIVVVWQILTQVRRRLFQIACKIVPCWSPWLPCSFST